MQEMGSASFSVFSKLPVPSAADRELEGRHRAATTPENPVRGYASVNEKKGQWWAYRVWRPEALRIWRPGLHHSRVQYLSIDLTKTWLQIQGQKNDANFKEIRYEGMLHALVRMGREKGLKSAVFGDCPSDVTPGFLWHHQDKAPIRAWSGYLLSIQKMKPFW